MNAHRFIFDSRDEASDERLEILNDREGVWRCRTSFNCTKACPRQIRITKAIGEVKKAVRACTLYGRLTFGGASSIWNGADSARHAAGSVGYAVVPQRERHAQALALAGIPSGPFLYSPKPREWSYGKWFRQITAAAGEQGL